MSASNQEPVDPYHENKTSYEEILTDIRNRYDNPLEELPYDNATELVNAAQKTTQRSKKNKKTSNKCWKK